MTGQQIGFGWRRLMRRIAARLSPIPQPLGGFGTLPDPYTVGDPDRGQDLAAGRFAFAGFRIDAPGADIYDLPTQGALFDEAVHSFLWLDDLAAAGTPAAQDCAQRWVLEWAKRFQNGQGPGWDVNLTGRRLLRMALNAEFTTRNMDAAEIDQLIRAMARQASYLKRNWRKAPQGLSRFEALSGLTFASLCIEGLDGFLPTARHAMARECREWVDDTGAIPTRNPDELLQIFCLLIWTSQALSDSSFAPDQDVVATIEKIAPTLRVLRHADGGLARFHGGGRGPEGWLDYGLAQSGVRPQAELYQAMGYTLLSTLRTSVLIDTAPPPTGPHATLAHASTLAFELTSGRRPVIVSCGSAASLSGEWQLEGRKTTAHSTAAVGDGSSARFGPKKTLAGIARATLVDGPQTVQAEVFESQVGRGVECWHDGYHQRYGLIHSRQMALSANGRFLAGEDTIAAVSDADKARFVTAQGGPQGLPFALHFHLHPDVQVITGEDASAVSLVLPSGENWVFRHDGHRALEVTPSLYFSRGKIEPTPTKQLILMGRMLNPAVQVNWSLAKADETPQGIRDLVGDEAVLTD